MLHYVLVGEHLIKYYIRIKKAVKTRHTRLIVIVYNDILAFHHASCVFLINREFYTSETIGRYLVKIEEDRPPNNLKPLQVFVVCFQ